jgi:HD-like signal output (HDOD) protein
MKLQTLICDQTSSTRDIKQALLQTPHLALGVINTANQRRRSTGHEIKSLEHAVSFIGRQAVSDLVLTETLQAFDFKTVEFNKHQYWQEAILTGQIAEYLAAQYAPELSPEEAYIAGSLCNIGKVVAAICLPMMADDVARATTNPRRPMNWVEAEHRLRAISHIALGEVAGAMWGFPEYVIHSLANHHTPPAQVPDLPLDPIAFLEADDEQDTKGPSMQQVVALANQYTHWVSGQLPRLDEPLLHQYTTIFQLDETQQTDLGHELIKAFHLPAS